jgi:hypothetical protein
MKIEKSGLQGATPGPNLSRHKGPMWFMLVLALIAGYFTFVRAYAKLTSPDWPVLSGQVLSSSMYQRTGRSRDWCLMLSYQYEFGGKLYKSRALGVSVIGDAGCHRERAVTERRLRRLAPGAPVQISYNPRSPAQAAVFITGLDPLDYFMAMIVLILTGGVAWEWHRLRQLSKW